MIMNILRIKFCEIQLSNDSRETCSSKNTREERFKANNLSYCLKFLEKDQIKSKVRETDIVKIRAKIKLN